MRKKTGQIERSLCNYASEALGATSKISHFSEWHSPAHKGRGEGSFSTLSQLIASLFPNKSFGGLFFQRLTPQTHARHTISRPGILKAVKQQTRTTETAAPCQLQYQHAEIRLQGTDITTFSSHLCLLWNLLFFIVFLLYAPNSLVKEANPWTTGLKTYEADLKGTKSARQPSHSSAKHTTEYVSASDLHFWKCSSAVDTKASVTRESRTAAIWFGWRQVACSLQGLVGVQWWQSPTTTEIWVFGSYCVNLTGTNMHVKHT